MTDWPLASERGSDERPTVRRWLNSKTSLETSEGCLLSQPEVSRIDALRQARELSITGTTGLRLSAAPDSVERS